MSVRARLLGAALPASALFWPLIAIAQTAPATRSDTGQAPVVRIGEEPDAADPDETLSVRGIRLSALVPKSSLSLIHI